MINRKKITIINDLEIDIKDACYGELSFIPCYEELLRDYGEKLLNRYSERGQVGVCDFENKAFYPIVKSLCEALAKQLNNEIIDFIDDDFNCFNKSKPVKLRVKLSQYISQRFKSDSQIFSKYVNSKIKSRLSNLMNLSRRNSIRVLNRISEDSDNIKKLFLNNLINPTLCDVISTGSDFHKQGQQVLILIFTDGQNSKKVIYKPSPITSDAMLFGDIKSLSDVDPDYLNHKSFIERMNEAITQKYGHESKDLLLPTYKVLPCCAKYETERKVKYDDFVHQYGYIEYLSHDPSDPHDYEESIRLHHGEKTAQEIYDSLYNEYLVSAMDDPNCDFIAVDKDAVERYSSDCGFLLSMMSAVGMSDSHLENLIIHKNRPMLIDGEVCLSLTKPTPTNTCAFNPRTGAFNATASKFEILSFLTETGKKSVIFNKKEKNILYQLDSLIQDKRVLITCQPDKKIVLDKYGEGLALMSEYNDLFISWFDQKKVLGMYVRVLPQNTAYFSDYLSAFKKLDFHEDINIDNYIQWCLGNLFKPVDIETYCEKIKEYNSARYCRQLADYPTYFNIVFHSHNARDYKCHFDDYNIYSEFVDNSIPVYYIRADSKELINCYGIPVPLPWQIVKLKEFIIDERSNNQTDHEKLDSHKLDTLKDEMMQSINVDLMQSKATTKYSEIPILPDRLVKFAELYRKKELYMYNSCKLEILCESLCELVRRNTRLILTDDNIRAELADEARVCIESTPYTRDSINRCIAARLLMCSIQTAAPELCVEIGEVIVANDVDISLKISSCPSYSLLACKKTLLEFGLSHHADNDVVHNATINHEDILTFHINDPSAIIGMNLPQDFLKQYQVNLCLVKADTFGRLIKSCFDELGIHANVHDSVKNSNFIISLNISSLTAIQLLTVHEVLMRFKIPSEKISGGLKIYPFSENLNDYLNGPTFKDQFKHHVRRHINKLIKLNMICGELTKHCNLQDNDIVIDIRKYMAVIKLKTYDTVENKALCSALKKDIPVEFHENDNQEGVLVVTFGHHNLKNVDLLLKNIKLAYADNMKESKINLSKHT